MFRMIWIALLAFSLLIVGCGDTESKAGKNTANNANNANNTGGNNANNTGGNNANNAGTNNGNNANNDSECGPDEVRAVVAGVEACYLACGTAECPEGFNCLQGAVCVAADTCETRVECSVDQECVDGTCRDHLFCDGSDRGIGGVSCSATWRNCSDEKLYELSCTDRVCTCSVNEVEVSTFESQDACYGDESIHRVANANCGWLVPETF